MTGPRKVDAGVAGQLVNLGTLMMQFAQTDRASFWPDQQTLESDTDHTVHLAISSAAFAAQFVPQLDLGKVIEFALIHDLVEAYAGDTPTLRLPTPEERADKANREAVALRLIEDQFDWVFPWVADTIHRYERQDCAEARYVKLFDKLVPKVVSILNGLKLHQDLGMTYGELADRYAAQGLEYQAYLDEFPEVRELRHHLLVLLFRETVGVLPGAPARPETIGDFGAPI